MSIEVALYSLLTADDSVAALVSTRIYPNVLPQGDSLPAIVYHQISGFREHASNCAVHLASPRFQINCWAESYLATRNLADAVRTCLDSYTGTVGTVKIYSIYLLDENDIPQISADVTRYCKGLDFEISFKE